jgi:hypothetical protein
MNCGHLGSKHSILFFVFTQIFLGNLVWLAQFCSWQGVSDRPAGSTTLYPQKPQTG